MPSHTLPVPSVKMPPIAAKSDGWGAGATGCSGTAGVSAGLGAVGAVGTVGAFGAAGALTGAVMATETDGAPLKTF